MVSAEMIAEYVKNNPEADLYAVVGVGSRRISRLHNMTVAKAENATDTAVHSFAPEYTSKTAQKTHNNNTVVIWLGNNGVHTVEIDTGIALTKNVTEAFGNIDDTYALTVTVPVGVEADPVAVDANGNIITATYKNNVITVNLKAGETAYISGIPGGTECTIGEVVDGDYYIASATEKVTVPLLSEVLEGEDQFAKATVTNAPNKYGNLTVIKDIYHDYVEAPAGMADKEFTFKVQLPAAMANKTFEIDTTNASLVSESTVTADERGAFEVSLKDNESVTIINIPEGTNYTVTEISAVPGYENTTGEIQGTIIPNFDNTAHFTNTYKVTPVKPEVTISGNKILVDSNDTYNENENFTFVLCEYVGVSDAFPTGYNVLAKDTAKAGEGYSFSLAEILTEAHGIGKYYYRITEEAGATDGMTYDSTRGLFAVTITDNDADGTLEYTVEALANVAVEGNTVAKDFTNIYNVSRTYADINIVKVLKNSTGVDIPKDLFHFNLVNVNDSSEIYNATTDASGKATIRVSELAEGTYTYKLSEIDGSMAGMSYDDTEYTVVINVTNEEGVLVAVANVAGAEENNDNSVSVTFVNEYKLDSVTHTISGKKELLGRAPKVGEFSFELYKTDSSFTIGSDANEVATNVGKTFAFSTITYDKVGTYYYSVKEKVGNVSGVTYDTTHYHVTVKVEIDVNDPTKLAVTDVSVNKVGHNSDTTGNIVFVNTYVANPIAYTISGIKILTGRAISAGEFKFRLYEGTRLIEEVSAKADGTFTFSPITYTEAGEYVYTVKEVKGIAPGVKYTGVDNPITVKVTVTDEDSILIAEADVANEDIKFVNEYVATPSTITFNGTKKLLGGEMNDGDFTFNLYETDHTFTVSGDPLDSVKNKNGGFEFDGIDFDKAGNYFFIIEESRENPIEGVVYDRTQYKLHVKIKDTGSGVLVPSVLVLNRNEEYMIFDHYDNSLTVPVEFENAVHSEAVQKEVAAHGENMTNIDGMLLEEGTRLTYFITYMNYNGTAVVVDIRDTIPAYTAYVEGTASHDATYIGGQLHWLVDVEAGGEITVSFDVVVDRNDAVISNKAEIRDGYNTFITNEVVNHTVKEPAKKDVFNADDISVSIDGNKVFAGDVLLYTITYKNVTAEKVSVIVTDKIPEGTVYVEGSADNGGVYADGALTWNIEELAAWSSLTVSFKVTVAESVEAQTITNEALVVVGNNSYTTNTVSTEIVVETPEADPDDGSENKPDNKPGDKTEANYKKPESPQTGDRNVLYLVMLLLISCGGFAATVAYGKKKKEEN